jgi:hypothetical protein
MGNDGLKSEYADDYSGRHTPAPGMSEYGGKHKDEFSEAESKAKAVTTFEILGMISKEKELFLFENRVKLTEDIEKWL